MKRQGLNSSAIVAAGYDATLRELELEFRGSRVYRYSNVPKSVFDWLCRTPDKQGYLARVIEPRFPHREVTPHPPQQDLLAALRASLDPDPHEPS